MSERAVHHAMRLRLLVESQDNQITEIRRMYRQSVSDITRRAHRGD